MPRENPLSHILRAALCVTLAAPALAQGNVAKGEKVFRKCAACHAVAVDAPARPGPALHDVVGRKSGSVEGFTYSEAMLALGAGGHVWSAEEIDRFVENPWKALPGTKMSFAGLKKPDERADLIAYLASLAPAAADPAAATDPATGAEPATKVAPAPP
ncbi:MAG: c-type cytochrome [Gemmobacter sp.]